MNKNYEKTPGEEYKTWLRRLHRLAHMQAEEKGGWMRVDSNLLSILLNNMETLLREE